MGRELIEKGVVVGNTYDKYRTRNPVARALVHGFLRAFDELAARADAASVLEVGCGEGELSMRVWSEGRQVVGTDISSLMIAEARKRAAARGIPVRFEQFDIFELGTDQERYDLVICCEVLEHLDDPIAAVRHLNSLSRGHLLFSVPREPMWRILNVARGRYLTDLGNTPGHVQHWSARSFRELLDKHFEVVAFRQPLPWSMALCRPDVSSR